MNEEEKIVSEKDLEQDGELILYEGNPFTGVGVDYHKNGQKKSEQNFKDGTEDGSSTRWYENGEKMYELHLILKNFLKNNYFSIFSFRFLDARN